MQNKAALLFFTILLASLVELFADKNRGIKAHSYFQQNSTKFIFPIEVYNNSFSVLKNIRSVDLQLHTFHSPILKSIATGYNISTHFQPNDPHKNQSLFFPHQTINSYDTLIFNFPAAINSGIFIDLPVMMRATDTVYSIDFSFKLNPQFVEIDSVINQTAGLQYLYHLNMNDSIFRFTCNRLTPISNDSTVVILRFRTNNGQLCATELDSVVTYLNGEKCSYSLAGCILSGLNSFDDVEKKATIFPNPATSYIWFNIPESFGSEAINFFDSNGRLALISYPSLSNSVNIQMLKPGMYLVEFSNKTTGDKIQIRLLKSGDF